MERLMARILFDTGSALLEFECKEVKERISSFKERHGVEAPAHFRELVVSSADQSISIPPEMVNFRVLAVELLGDGIGKATSKACNRTYAKELIWTQYYA
jgi:hypothetical protein